MPGLNKAKELREERASVYKDMEAIITAPEGEDGALTSEQQETWDNLDTRFEELTTEIQSIEDEAQREHERRQRMDAINDEIKRDVRAGRQDFTETKDERIESAEELEKRRSAAWGAYLRGGVNAVEPEDRKLLTRSESRAQSVAQDTKGGFLAPEAFLGRFDRAMKFFGGMRQSRATVIGTSDGRDIPIPTMDDTSNTGRLLGENKAVTSTDVTLGEVVLHAYKYSSDLVLVSWELMQDDQYDLEGRLASILGERIGRITNTHFTNGDGAAKPYGIVAQSTQGTQGGTGQTTSVTVDDLYDLEHAVDRAYRDMAEWMFHDLTLRELKQLKDGEGRPLWQAGIAGNEPNTLLGYPYIVNNDVPQMAASAKSILFGDLSKYHIRDVRALEIIRLNERYADNMQTGFFGFYRGDGVLVDAGQNPVQHYANSAS